MCCGASDRCYFPTGGKRRELPGGRVFVPHPPARAPFKPQGAAFEPPPRPVPLPLNAGGRGLEPFPLSAGGRGLEDPFAVFGARATRATTARIVPTSFFMTFSFVLPCLIAEHPEKEQSGCQVSPPPLRRLKPAPRYGLSDCLHSRNREDRLSQKERSQAGSTRRDLSFRTSDLSFRTSHLSIQIR